MPNQWIEDPFPYYNRYGQQATRPNRPKTITMEEGLNLIRQPYRNQIMDRLYLVHGAHFLDSIIYYINKKEDAILMQLRQLLNDFELLNKGERLFNKKITYDL